jgi:hypothetical protein
MFQHSFNKSTSAAAQREAEAEMRTMAAFNGVAPSVGKQDDYYVASEIGWDPRLKAGYIQIHGQAPTGPGALAERMRHCRWFWEHQETPENKKLIIEGWKRYKKEHARIWADERESLETPTGDSLTAAERQEYVVFVRVLRIDANVVFSKILAYIPVMRRVNNGLSKRLGAGVYTLIVAPLVPDNGMGEQLRAMLYVLFVQVCSHVLTTRHQRRSRLRRGCPDAH